MDWYGGVDETMAHWTESEGGTKRLPRAAIAPSQPRGGNERVERTVASSNTPTTARIPYIASQQADVLHRREEGPTLSPLMVADVVSSAPAETLSSCLFGFSRPSVPVPIRPRKCHRSASSVNAMTGSAALGRWDDRPSRVIPCCRRVRHTLVKPIPYDTPIGTLGHALERIVGMGRSVLPRRRTFRPKLDSAKKCSIWH